MVAVCHTLVHIAGKTVVERSCTSEGYLYLSETAVADIPSGINDIGHGDRIYGNLVGSTATGDDTGVAIASMTSFGIAKCVGDGSITCDGPSIGQIEAVVEQTSSGIVGCCGCCIYISGAATAPSSIGIGVAVVGTAAAVPAAAATTTRVVICRATNAECATG